MVVREAGRRFFLRGVLFSRASPKLIYQDYRIRSSRLIISVSVQAK